MDFYIVLGVERDASLPELKRAYRRLARRFHPDVNPGDDRAARRFRQIAEAFATLSDPARRQRYDRLGYEPPEQASVAADFAGFDFSAAVHANQQSTFGDLFAEMFRADGPVRVAPERGADLHSVLRLSFAEAMEGGEHRVTVVRHEACRDCAGSGQRTVAAAPCGGCQGTGQQQSARGHMVFRRLCPRCRGTGQRAEEPCTACGGLGRQSRSERVAVVVPAGVTDGSRLRVAGKGHAGRFGGTPGDLYVSVGVQPHPVLRREGDDLHVVLPVALHEAGLGARIEIPGVDRPARVRIPPGTQSGQRLRLRGRGAPSPRDGRRGDLVVEVRLVLPRLLDERSRELLREFGAINGENVRDEFDRSWHDDRVTAGPPAQE